MHHSVRGRSHLVILAAMALLPAAASAQGPTVASGLVRASDGTALANATVSISSLRVGATTTRDGQYQLTIPASAAGPLVMTARRIGYKPASVTITPTGAAIRQDFTLEVSPTELSEVVVTAMGVEKQKSKLGTAQQQLNAGELNTTRAQNLIQQIQGKVSGVQISSPGTQGSRSGTPPRPRCVRPVHRTRGSAPASRTPDTIPTA